MGTDAPLPIFVCLAFLAVDISNLHFPKKGPAQEYKYKPKTHKSRYRNYKTRPEHPMIHTLARSPPP